MSKKTFKVEKILKATDSIFVPLKKGLMICLFAVAMEADATPNYDYAFAANIPPSQICLPKTDLSVQLENNIETEVNALYYSLMLNRGKNLSANEMADFWKVAKQVSEIEFKESMVCYDEEDREISYDLLTTSDTIIHLTQYFEEPTDQVVFSIEKDGTFLYAGHLPIDDISPLLLKRINEIEQKS